MNGLNKSTTELLDELSGAEIFKNVDLSQLQDHLSEIRQLEITRGDILLSISRSNEEIHFLVEGELKICLDRNGSNEIALVLPGDCVGEISIIDDRPPSAYVKATTDSKVISINRSVLVEMYQKQTELAANLLKLIANRFRQNTAVLTRSVELQREYQDKSERDGLTGIYNRSWMNEVFPKQIELSRHLDQKISMLLIDADHFKNVNDEFGHRAGDATLVELANSISCCLQESDLLVRYGGEEFVVLMPGASLSQARVISENIRRKVTQTPVTLDDQIKIEISVSIGIAEANTKDTVDDLLERTDKGLYQAKQNGRNQIAVV